MESTLKIPANIPIIALSGAVLFPHSLLPLHIFEERYRQMLGFALNTDRIVGVAHISEDDETDSDIPNLHPVMGIGVIRACVERDEGTSDLILQGIARVRVLGDSQTQPFRVLQTEVLRTEISDLSYATVLSDRLRHQGKLLSTLGYKMSPQMDQYLESIEDPEIIGDLLASTFIERPEIRQQVLSEKNLEIRLEIILKEMKLLNTH